MSTFFVECYVPSFTREKLELLTVRVREGAAAMRANGTQVHALGYVLLLEEETVFCLFEAPALDAVHELIGFAGIQADRVVDAVHIPRSCV